MDKKRGVLGAGPLRKMFTAFYKSKLGLLKLSYNDKIKKIEFVDSLEGENVKSELSDYFYSQIDEYLEGNRRVFEGFDLLDSSGTDFQKSVWAEILKVSYGRTSSYKDLALAIGKPRAFQAVGTAVGANPLAIIIPCHRIIRGDGSMGDYAYGQDIKEELLRLEGVYFK